LDPEFQHQSVIRTNPNEETVRTKLIMKKLAFIAALAVASLSVHAQGKITFSNRVVGTVDAPVFDVGGTTKLSGTTAWAQIYAGAAGVSDASKLVAVGAPVNFRTGAAAGYVVPPASDVTINGVGAGAVASLQVRAWTGTATSFEAAKTAGASYGSSSIFQSAALGGDPGTGAPPLTSPALVGLTSFSLVPEPSTIALGALGAAALLLRRRK